MVAGGAILNAHPDEGEETHIRGSAVIYTGETETEVRNTIANDPYARAGVWDLDKVQVIPVSSHHLISHNPSREVMINANRYIIWDHY